MKRCSMILVLLLLLTACGSNKDSDDDQTPADCSNGCPDGYACYDDRCQKKAVLGDPDLIRDPVKKDPVKKDPVEFVSDYIEPPNCTSECCDDNMCDFTEKCEDNRCVEVSCGACEFAIHGCYESSCCSDADCDDGNISTSDNCILRYGRCNNYPMMFCNDGDSICPEGCYYGDDDDCGNKYILYDNELLKFRLEYPGDWEIEQDILERDVQIIDRFTGNNILISAKPYHDTLQDFVDNTKDDLEADDEYFQILDESDLLVSGIEGKKLKLYAYGAYMVALYLHDDDTIYQLYLTQAKEDLSEELLHAKDTFEIVKKEWEPAKTPYLWKIERDPPSYLFGTVHLTNEALRDIPDEVIAAVDESDVVFFEVVPTPLMQIQAAKMVQRVDGTLADDLPPELYERLEAYMERNGLAMTFVNNMEVWGADMLLSEISMLQMDQKDLVSIDSMIMGRAMKADAELKSLESVEDLRLRFEDYPVEWQVQSLEMTLDGLEHMGRVGGVKTEAIFYHYLNGDIQAIDDMIYNALNLTHEPQAVYLDLIFGDRNRDFVTDIHAALQANPDKSFFIATGAAHYPGDFGLVNLLRLKGYEIDRVS